MSPREEQARFFGKVGTLVGAGVPLLPALEKAAAGIRMPALAAAIGRIVRRAYGGASLTEAFGKESALFAPEVMALLEHGERTGDIDRKADAIADGLNRGVLDAPRPPETEAEDGLLAFLAEAGETDALLERGPAGWALRVRGESGLESRELPEGVDSGAVHAEVEGRVGSSSFRGRWVTIRRIERRDGIEYPIRWDDASRPLPALPDDAEAWVDSGAGLILVAGLPGRPREDALDALLDRAVAGAGRGGRLGAAEGRAMAGVEDYDSATLRVWPDLAHLPVVAVPEPETASDAAAALGAGLSGLLVIAPVTRPDAKEAAAGLADLGPGPEPVRAALSGVLVVPPGGEGLRAVTAEEALRERS